VGVAEHWEGLGAGCGSEAWRWAGVAPVLNVEK
jgi:hypothetical protein